MSRRPTCSASVRSRPRTARRPPRRTVNGRFQERNVAVLETEVRYDIDERWSLVAFVGAGRAWGERVSFEDAGRPVAGGGGFRYLIARRLGLYAGIDYAKSTFDEAVYIQVGSAWR
jgi:hypothetical protein